MKKKNINKRRMSKKKKIVLWIIGILIAALSALGVHYYLNPDQQPEWFPTPEPEKRLQIIDVNSKTRPFAVMINNHPTARLNHSGLQDAFIIYEIIVEGGMTRYLALFKDQTTEKIGSVRSARHYFLDYALENDAFFVHHGQSPQSIPDANRLGVDRIVVDTNRIGWRDNSLRISTEHRLFTSFERLKLGIGSKRNVLNQKLLLNYSIEEIYLNEMEGAEVANTITVRYPALTTQYEFDAENKVYRRSVAENRGTMRPHTDAITNQQFTFKNIIIYQVENRPLSGGGGRQDLMNVGNGTGWFVTNGYAVPITWNKSSRSAQTVYSHMDGREIDVNDGNTFIQIQPKGRELTIS